MEKHRNGDMKLGECAAMAATTAACIHVLKISVAGLHIPVLKKKNQSGYSVQQYGDLL